MNAMSEEEGLKLVSDLVDEVTNALKSLVGKKHEGPGNRLLPRARTRETQACGLNLCDE